MSTADRPVVLKLRITLGQVLLSPAYHYQATASPQTVVMTTSKDVKRRGINGQQCDGDKGTKGGRVNRQEMGCAAEQQRDRGGRSIAMREHEGIRRQWTNLQRG